MKYLKQSIVKRIFAFILCTVLLSSTVFLSYENTMVVRAVDNLDLLIDAAIVCFSGLGLILSGPTVGTVISILGPEMTSLGKDVYDYVTENEDGTTTISADFVNLVLQAYQEYTKQIFDGTIDYDDQTMRYIYGSSSYKLTGPNGMSYASQISGFESYYPVAFLLVPGTTEYKYASWGTSGFNSESTGTGFGGFLFYYNLNPDSSYDGIQLIQRFPNTLAKPPTTVMYTNGVARNPMEGFWVQNISGVGASDPYFVSFNSSTIPVYTSFDAMRNAFHSGDYTSAENYTVGGSSAGQTSSYTGEYTGGDITVDTEKLDSISDKLAELEESNSNIEDILKELLEWLKLNGGGGGSGGGGDVIVDVDLTETNSWLSKIFQKLDEFNENFKSFFIFKDSPGINAKYISSLLERILEQLRGSGQIEPSEPIEPEDPDGSDDSIIDAALAKIQKSIEDLNENFKSFFIFKDAPGINAKYISSLLERILAQLRGIGDDLSDIKDQLEDMSEQEFSKQTESFLDDTMDSFSEISEKAKGKFPFSIPNDIRLLITKMSVSQPEDPGQGTYSVQTMSDVVYESNGLISVMDESGSDPPVISETGAPIFYLPFVIASVGIEEYVLIDLSGFEPVSSFCRSMMTIWFVLCLYNLTFKVMGLWGDLVD